MQTVGVDRAMFSVLFVYQWDIESVINSEDTRTERARCLWLGMAVKRKWYCKDEFYVLLRDAATAGNEAVCRVLLNKPNIWNTANLGPLVVLAALKNRLGIILLLEQHGANIHAGGKRALMKASGYGHLEIVKYLAKDINRQELQCAAHVAINNGHRHVTSFFARKWEVIQVQRDE
jgi:hypothetical protein